MLTVLPSLHTYANHLKDSCLMYQLTEIYEPDCQLFSFF